MNEGFSGFDIIGDVHGCYRALCHLLEKLGYVQHGGVWRHGDRRRPRQALFLGDLLDRGPHVRETALTVQAMVAAGAARMILGNHEHHALVWSTPAPPTLGRPWLRDHSPRNHAVLAATLEQFANHPADWRGLLTWMRSLPLLLDCDATAPARFRMIHACWDQALVDPFLASHPDAVLSDELLVESVVPGTFGARLVGRATSGLNLRLPEGRRMRGRDGVERATFRGKFWVSEAPSYGELAFQPDPLPDDIATRPLSDEMRVALVGYDAAQPPLFVGHYWQQGRPQRICPNIACLDYSAVKGGRLVAYRMDGESELDNGKFVWVDERS